MSFVFFSTKAAIRRFKPLFDRILVEKFLPEVVRNCCFSMTKWQDIIIFQWLKFRKVDVLKCSPAPPVPSNSPPTGLKLTNKRQFFMCLSCYWSWISSSHRHEAIAEWFPQTNLTMLWPNSWSIIYRRDALKTDINLFFMITNCRIAGSHSLTRHMNFKFCVCPHIDNKN